VLTRLILYNTDTLVMPSGRFQQILNLVQEHLILPFYSLVILH